MRDSPVDLRYLNKICACFNHRKKMKVEPSRRFLRMCTEKLVFLFVSLLVLPTK